MSQFIGLDIGSSTVKGALIDLDSLTIRESVRVPFPDPVRGLPAHHFEIEPQAIIEAVQTVLDQLTENAQKCAGVLSCSQMAGVILADRSGNPLTNYLSWRDQRVLESHPSGLANYYEVLCDRVADSNFKLLGKECKLGSAPSLLFWLAEQGRLPPSGIPLMLGDYVWMSLCNAEPATEYTNALGSLNLETLDWHREVFEDLGIAGLKWPQLCDPYQPIGELKIRGRHLPCFPSVGDHQCALAGMLLAPNELSINASTGSQVSLIADTFASGDYQVRPYFDRRYLNTITHLPAGRSLNVLVDLLSELAFAKNVELGDCWDYINRSAEEGDTDLAVNLAFFAGPMGERGSVENISVDNLTIGSLFRAAFRNMADNYDACSRKLLPDRSWDRVVLSGGLVQQCRLLKQMILQNFDCPVRSCSDSEATFSGLLLLGLVCDGQASNMAEASDILRKKKAWRES